MIFLKTFIHCYIVQTRQKKLIIIRKTLAARNKFMFTLRRRFLSKFSSRFGKLNFVLSGLPERGLRLCRPGWQIRPRSPGTELPPATLLSRLPATKLEWWHSILPEFIINRKTFLHSFTGRNMPVLWWRIINIDKPEPPTHSLRRWAWLSCNTGGTFRGRQWGK